MAAGTVGYTDTRGGDRDYLGSVAKSIGNRIKQASNMAREERAFAAKKAEEQGTSLEEAGIGKGYFFKRALGSRFGGDRIARTRGRFESDPPAGRDPTKNYKQRFRGGFDYKVTNQINQLTSNAIVPMSGAIATGMRQVQVSVEGVSSALVQISNSMNNLATAQQDLARQAMMNGAFMRAFMTWMQTQQSRSNARAEERSIEGRGMRQLPRGKGGSFIDIPALPSGGGPKGISLIDSLSRGRQVAKGAGSVVRGGTGKSLASASAGAVRATKSAGTSIQAMVNTGKTIQNINPTGLFNMATRMGLQGPAAVDFVKQAQNTQELARNASSMQRIVSGAKNANVEDAKTLQRFLEAPGDLVTNSNSMKAAGAAVDAGIDNPGFLKQLFSKKSVKGLARGSALQRAIIKAGGKSILKKIPVVAGIAGMIFGLQRLAEGDFLGAGLEFGSGLLGAIGVGAPVGLAMDGMLLARDLGAVEFAKGGLVKGGRGGVLGMVGEGQRDELIEPVDKDLYTMKAEAEAEYREKNPKPYIDIAAKGNQKYYDKMGGWNSFAEKFKEIFETLKQVISDTLKNLNPLNWRPFGGGNDNGTGLRPGSSAGSDNLDKEVGLGGGLLKGLSKEDFEEITRTVQGEAGPGDDQYLVAAAILNRVASRKFPNSVKAVVQAGQNDGGPVQFEGYHMGASLNQDILKRLQSPEGQARIVAALERLQGRTDFKGQTQLKNYVPGEDVMVDTKGNFAHYWWQTGPNSRMPSDFTLPDYQRFIEKKNNEKPSVSGLTPTTGDLEWWKKQTQPDTSSSLSPQMSPLFRADALNTQSAFATSALTLPPIINNVTNNYGAGGQLDTSGANTAGAAFSGSGLDAFTQFYSLASK